MTDNQDPRALVLDGAKACVLVNRNVSYGEPEDNFARIAYLWSAYLWGRGLLPVGVLIETHDVAIMSSQIKQARIMESPQNLDHWVDCAGYTACGYRCVVESSKA